MFKATIEMGTVGSSFEVFMDEMERLDALTDWLEQHREDIGVLDDKLLKASVDAALEFISGD